MRELKPCPCGKTPKYVFIIPGGSSKWAWVAGQCCNEWTIEFRTQYLDLESPKCMALAIAAWNEAPRGGDMRLSV